MLLSTAINSITLNDGVCSYQKRERNGDLKFLVVAGIHGSTNDGKCNNDISKTTYDHLAALEWTLNIINGQRINNISFLPGVTIGYDIYDNCDNEDLTTDLLYDGEMADQTMTCSQPSEQPPIYIGVISLTTPNASTLISRFTNSLPVFRPLMSSPILQTFSYNNLLQTVVTFQQEAMAITKMLTTIDWNYIALVYSEEFYEAAEMFSEIAHAHSICLKEKALANMKSVHILHTALNEAFDKSLAVVYFGSPSDAKEFLEQERKETRPFRSKIHWIFMSHITPTSGIEKRSSDTITYIQYSDSETPDFTNAFNGLTIPNLEKQGDKPIANPHHMFDTVMVTVSAVKHLWQDKCGLSQDANNCPELSTAVLNGTLLEYVKRGVNISEVYDVQYSPYVDNNRHIMFDDNGYQQYEQLNIFINKDQRDTQVGVYNINSHFERSNLQYLPSSAAGFGQHDCLDNINVKYSYLHGDVLFLGLFTVRNAGTSPFECGLTRRGVSDIITVSSFFESVRSQRRANDKNILGAIAIDDCYNGVYTSEYLTSLFSKKRFIYDPSSGKAINFDDVIVIIGALSSPVTLQVADLATAMNLPMLSYSASSPDLENRIRYPYFLRSVPSDSLQIQGMIKVLTTLDISHVGLLYIDDAYGKAGKIQLEEEARRHKICVKPPIQLSQNMTNDDLDGIVDKLEEQQVRVVLFFGIDTVAKQILDVMDNPPIFVASEAWGTNQKLIAGQTGQKSKGSIVFNINSKSNDNTDYKSYLKSLNASHTYLNRWLPKYFEDYNGCYSIDSFEKPKSPQPKICSDDFTSTLDTNTTDNLYNDQRAVHTMNSVYAASTSLRQVCDDCSSSSVKQLVHSYFMKLKKVTFKGTQETMFDEDGNGNIGYTIYNIRRKTSTPGLPTTSYEQIGTYTKNGELQLNKLPVFYDEKNEEITLQELRDDNRLYCERFQLEETCSKVCPMVTTLPPTTVRATESVIDQPPVNGSWKTIAIAFIFGFGIVVCVLLGILIRPCIMKRTSSDRGDSSGKATSESHSVYDDPLPDRHFDNLVFMPDSASIRSHSQAMGSIHEMSASGMSLGGYVPSQLNHVRQMSNPELRFHHVRQLSKPEIGSNTFDTLERPMSTLSAPAYKPHSGHSPNAKRLQHKTGHHKGGKHGHSPKTPHSAPSNREKKQPVVYRPRAQSSPRFRYPSTDESHYTIPTIDRRDHVILNRKYGTSEEDITNIQSDIDFMQIEPYFNGQQASGDDEPKLNYLSAADLVNNASDEEEDAVSDSNDTVQYTDAQFIQKTPLSGTNSDNLPSGGFTPIGRDLLQQSESSSRIGSPSGNEVMEINTPKLENRNLKQLVQNPVQSVSSSGTGVQGPSNQVTDFKRNISDVPDVIKHGQYDEDCVFII
ncbi:hypothetical protein ACF0H5_013946 [Mactra antiquata]